MKKEWIVVDYSDGEYRINLGNVRYIKSDRTNSKIRLFFAKDHALSIGMEGAGAKITLSKEKFGELLRELPII